MKNTIGLFLLSILLMFASFNTSMASSIDEKGGTVHVVIDKKGGTVLVVIAKLGQPIASFEIPSIYATNGTKPIAAVNIEVIDPMSGNVIFSAVSNSNSFNLPTFKSGEYLLVLSMLDFTHKELVTF